MAELPLTVALGLAMRVIEPRASIPILSNLLLEADGERLHLKATDLDTEVTATVASSASAFRTTVNGQVFSRVATEENAGNLRLDGKSLVVGAGPTFTLDSLPAEDFPLIKQIEPTVSFELPAPELLASLQAVAPAVSREEARYYLMGINLECCDGRLTFLATDGHRLHILEQSAPKGCGAIEQAIIPRRAVKVLRKTLAALPAETVKVRLERLKAEIEIGPLTIKTKLIDGTYPNARRVIPTDAAGRLVVAADDLLACADAATAMGAAKPFLTLDFKNGLVVSKHIGEGAMSCALPGKQEGKLPDQISFNAGYLGAICKAFAGLPIKLGFGDAATPVLITSAESELRTVLMPVRT